MCRNSTCVHILKCQTCSAWTLMSQLIHKQTHTYLLFRLLPHWLNCLPHEQISLFCTSAAAVMFMVFLVFFFLPIIHFIASTPFLSAVFYHTYYHFLEQDKGEREKKNSSTVKGSAANTTNQHYLVCMEQPKLSCYKLACGSRPTVHCISQMPSM